MNWLYNDFERPAEEVTKIILKYHNLDSNDLIELNPVSDMKKIANKNSFRYRE